MSLERVEKGLRRLLSVAAADGDACAPGDLFRYASGEATREEAEAFERHLARCDSCRADLEVFRGLSQQPAATTPARARWREWFSGWRLVPVAAAASALLALGAWRAQSRWTPPEDLLEAKGGYKLHVAVQRGEQRFMGTSGSILKTGDTLGFFYTASADVYLTALVADGTGSIAQAYPAAGQPGKLARGVEQRLAAGAVVQDGASCEWIVAFFSPKPLAVETLRTALARAVARRGPDCALPAISLPAAVDVYLVRRATP
ncbi:MAG TPA: zf-HC2 domain-containing protein [Myxococcales bacterium]|jgi:hypothetical protein